MPRSSHHKSNRSHKHSSRHATERSDSEDDGSSRDRRLRLVEGSPGSGAKVSRDAEAEKRRSSSSIQASLRKVKGSSINGDFSSGKKRKEREEDINSPDRWNSCGKDERMSERGSEKSSLRAMDPEKEDKSRFLSVESKNRSGRRHDGSTDKCVESGSRTEFAKRTSEKEHARRDYRDDKEKDANGVSEREKERERAPEREKKVQDSKHGKSDDAENSSQRSKRGRVEVEWKGKKDITESRALDDLRNTELEKDHEKFMAKQRGFYGGIDKGLDDGRKSNDRSVSCRDDPTNDGSPRVEGPKHDDRRSSRDDHIKNGHSRVEGYKDDDRRLSSKKDHIKNENSRDDHIKKGNSRVEGYKDDGRQLSSNKDDDRQLSSKKDHIKNESPKVEGHKDDDRRLYSRDDHMRNVKPRVEGHKDDDDRRLSFGVDHIKHGNHRVEGHKDDDRRLSSVVDHIKNGNSRVDGHKNDDRRISSRDVHIVNENPRVEVHKDDDRRLSSRDDHVKNGNPRMEGHKDDDRRLSFRVDHNKNGNHKVKGHKDDDWKLSHRDGTKNGNHNIEEHKEESYRDNRYREHKEESYRDNRYRDKSKDHNGDQRDQSHRDFKHREGHSYRDYTIDRQSVNVRDKSLENYTRSRLHGSECELSPRSDDHETQSKHNGMRKRSFDEIDDHRGSIKSCTKKSHSDAVKDPSNLGKFDYRHRGKVDCDSNAAVHERVSKSLSSEKAQRKDRVYSDDREQLVMENASASLLHEGQTGHFPGSSPAHLISQPPVRHGMVNPYDAETRFTSGDRWSNNRYRSKNGPNCPPPLLNGFIPFQHGPPGLGFNAQHFPPFFGARPYMEMNHTGTPYHAHDLADQGRPFGWHQPVYRKPDWSQNRNYVGGSGWEFDAEISKVQGSNMVEFSSHELVDESKGSYADCNPNGEVEHFLRASNDAAHAKRVNDTPDDKSKEACRETKQNRTLQFGKKADDDGRNLCYYFSKIEISADLVRPELYKEISDLLSAVDLKDVSKNENESAKKNKNQNFGKFLNLRSSRSTAAANATFQRAMSLYEKQNCGRKVKPPSLPNGTAPTSDGITAVRCSSPKDPLASNSSSPICIEEKEEIENSGDNIINQSDKNSHALLVENSHTCEACVPVCKANLFRIPSNPTESTR